jgi:transposase
LAGNCSAIAKWSRLSHKWRLNKSLYKQRNIVERLIRRIKGFRSMFTRCDKLDALNNDFVSFALAWIFLISANRP